MTLQRPSTVPEPPWNDLLGAGTPLKIATNELLWEPGDVHEEESFLVLRGLLRLYHPSRNGEAVTLLAVGAGGLIGHHREISRPHATSSPTALKTKKLTTSGVPPSLR